MTDDAPVSKGRQKRVGNKSPPVEHQFKKGEVRNPLGAGAHNPELRKLKTLTEQELVEVGSLVIKGSIVELQAIMKDPNCTALKAMMASVAIKAINKGDGVALDILLNRIVGKVKERVEQTLTVEPTIEYKTKWGSQTEAIERDVSKSDEIE